jgi:hypothetical protein
MSCPQQSAWIKWDSGAIVQAIDIQTARFYSKLRFYSNFPNMASEAPATAQVSISVASGRLNSKGLNHNAAAAASCAPAPQQTALNFDCLNGLRALGSIAVVVFHCFIIWEEMVPFETSSWVRRGTWAGR